MCFLASTFSTEDNFVIYNVYEPNKLLQNTGFILFSHHLIYFQVTTHISSVSDIFVHDGAIGSTSTSTSTLQIDAKVRVISDNPTATCAFHNILFQTPTRAVSHDSCPLTVYVASSIRLEDKLYYIILYYYLFSKL